MLHPIYLIVAVDTHLGIGKNGQLPWKIKTDMKFFAQTTRNTIDPEKENLIIMGRTTWESISPNFRPLSGRKNVILTAQSNYEAEGATICHSLEEAINLADDNTENIFIIGGGKVFAEIIKNPRLTGIYLTKIDKTYNCDTFFPALPPEFNQVEKLKEDTENGIKIKYFLYKKQP